MEHLDEVRGSVLAAILTGIFLAFIIQLFSGDGQLADFFQAIAATIGGPAS